MLRNFSWLESFLKGSYHAIEEVAHNALVCNPLFYFFHFFPIVLANFPIYIYIILFYWISFQLAAT